ncbi:MAG TPA: hypothetical protein VD905_02135 [Flavobacteriales bacterium]|nr:hypothetical protein [Flavobacteriales bacterium]
MKKGIAFLLVFLLPLPAFCQQFRFGADIVLGQYMHAPMQGNLLLDTALQNNTYFYMDHITQRTVQWDFPGAFVQWDTKMKFYFRANARISRLKVNVGSSYSDERKDTLLLNDDWTVLRPVLGAEIGYLAGKKINHIFGSCGITMSQLRFQNSVVKYFGYNDYDATNFYNYFNASPFFLSLQLRAGIKRKAFSFNMCFQRSFTPIDLEQKVKEVGYVTAEVSWDVYRTGYLTRKQYKTASEITDLDYKTSVDLKKSSASTGLHLPAYIMTLDKIYNDAYADSASNYLVSISKVPEVKFFPEIYTNNARAFNKKKTLYLKQESGFNLFTIIYKEAVRRAFYNNVYPDLQNSNDLVVIYADVKQRYLRLFYSFKTGAKLKTGRKSFLYYEVGLRYSLTLKSYREKTFIPYMNRHLFWGNSEAGYQIGHQGINFGVIKSLGKTDAYSIYKNVNMFYIGLYHEISSK